MVFASTICFPVVTFVDEEAGDFAEDFEQDSVVERHGGGDDGGMMSNGNGGVMLLWGIFDTKSMSSTSYIEYDTKFDAGR